MTVDKQEDTRFMDALAARREAERQNPNGFVAKLDAEQAANAGKPQGFVAMLAEQGITPRQTQSFVQSLATRSAGQSMGRGQAA